MLDRLVRLTLVGVFSLAIAGVSTAQADDHENPCAGNPCADNPCAGNPCADNPCAGNPCAVDGGDTHQSSDSGTSAAWPIEIIDRPLTLPAGAFSIGAALNSSASFDVFDAETAGLWGLSYGVTNEFSVGVGYDIRLDPDASAEGTLDLELAYTFYTGAATLTATGGLSYDIDGETFGTDLGVQAWYNITKQIAIITPGDQINITYDPTIARLNLPVYVGFQAAPNIFAQLETSIGNIKLKDGGDSAFIFADNIPVHISAFYSLSNALDIGLRAGFSDLKNDAGDNFDLGLTAIYYGGVN